MLGGVGRQLVQHHRHRLGSLRAQRQLGTVEIGVVPRHVGRKLAPHELAQRHALPLPAAQELVGRGHGLNAARERRHEILARQARVLRSRSDGADGGKDVLDPMVELGHQHLLVLLRPLALGDIDVDAHHPFREAVAAVRNETARLDPPHLASGSDNAILDVVFAVAARGKRGCAPRPRARGRRDARRTSICCASCGWFPRAGREWLRSPRRIGPPPFRNPTAKLPTRAALPASDSCMLRSSRARSACLRSVMFRVRPLMRRSRPAASNSPFAVSSSHSCRPSGQRKRKLSA